MTLEQAKKMDVREVLVVVYEGGNKVEYLNHSGFIYLPKEGEYIAIDVADRDDDVHEWEWYLVIRVVYKVFFSKHLSPTDDPALPEIHVAHRDAPTKLPW